MRYPIPQHKREHPDAALESGFAPFGQSREQNLRVRTGTKPMPERSKLVAQLEMVINFAIVDDPIAVLCVPHRLLRRVGQVDYAEPPVPERDGSRNAVEHPPAGPIRPAM